VEQNVLLFCLSIFRRIQVLIKIFDYVVIVLYFSDHKAHLKFFNFLKNRKRAL